MTTFLQPSQGSTFGDEHASGQGVELLLVWVELQGFHGYLLSLVKRSFDLHLDIKNKLLQPP